MGMVAFIHASWTVKYCVYHKPFALLLPDSLARTFGAKSSSNQLEKKQNQIEKCLVQMGLQIWEICHHQKLFQMAEWGRGIPSYQNVSQNVRIYRLFPLLSSMWCRESPYHVIADDSWASRKKNLWFSMHFMQLWGKAVTPTYTWWRFLQSPYWQSCLNPCMLRVYNDLARTIILLCRWQVLLMSGRKLGLHTSSTKGSRRASRNLSISER